MLSQSRRARSKMRSRFLTSVAVLGISASTLVVAAAPAQARPRSCANLYQSLIFFSLAMDLDTGVNAQYLARDTYWYNRVGSQYDAAGC